MKKANNNNKQQQQETQVHKWHTFTLITVPAHRSEHIVVGAMAIFWWAHCHHRSPPSVAASSTTEYLAMTCSLNNLNHCCPAHVVARCIRRDANQDVSPSAAVRLGNCAFCDRNASRGMSPSGALKLLYCSFCSRNTRKCHRQC